MKQLEAASTDEIVPGVIVLQDGTLYVIRSHGTERAFFRFWDAGTQPVPIFKYTDAGFNAGLVGSPAVAADGSVYMIPEGSTLYKFGS